VGASAQDNGDRLVPDFWDKTEKLLRSFLSIMRVDDHDIDAMASDLMRRYRLIEPIIPPELAQSLLDYAFKILLVEAIAAEHRLFAAKNGRPSEGVKYVLGDTWPPAMTSDGWPPIRVTVTHPFLVAVQAVARQLEAEANAAEGGQRVN
jgi:hypothetical protein